jgi:hypothetical protein
MARVACRRALSQRELLIVTNKRPTPTEWQALAGASWRKAENGRCSVEAGEMNPRREPDSASRPVQPSMNDFLCPSCLVPSRIGILWSRLAFLPPPCRGHVSADIRERFDAAQDLLVELGQLERGPFFTGLPARWFVGPVQRFRCGRGHVHTSTDSSKVVAGECPICHEPIALTFPEDVSDPCQQNARDYLVSRDRMRAVLLGVFGARG